MSAQTPAERQRAYRLRQGAKNTPGPEPSAACGTVSAYKRHLRKHEPIDTPCREAWNAYHRARYAGRSPQQEKAT